MSHQAFAFALARALHAATQGSDLMVLMAPFDVVLGPHVVEPDIVVAPRHAFREQELPAAPVVVVEVHSPSTAWIDEGRKRSLYEEAGVAHYWLADPSEPSITMLDLVDGRLVETGRARGDEEFVVQRPFRVELVASRLARG